MLIFYGLVGTHILTARNHSRLATPDPKVSSQTGALAAKHESD